MRKSTLFTLTLLAVCVALLSTGYIAWRYWPSHSQVSEIEESPNLYEPAIALRQSQLFSDLQTAYKQGDTRAVEELYKQGQGTYALGTSERNVIDYDYAYFLTFGTPDPLHGITELKRIAVNGKDYSRLTRALAIENLGRAYFAYNSAEVNTKIFEEEPFHTFLNDAGGNHYEAVIALLGWGMELRPTPTSALRIAESYSRKLRFEENATPEEKSAWREAYDLAMETADTEVQNIEGEPSFNRYMADYYMTKATTMSHIVYAGLSIDTEAIHGAYKRAIELAEGNAHTFALYNYAFFLSKADPEGARATVEDLVMRIASSKSQERELFETKLRNTLKNKTGNYDDVAYLMEQNASFKTYAERVRDADTTAP